MSVIYSVHRETGLANVPELLDILERAQPDVIFLELPPADFDAWFDGRRSCLEATAASVYRNRHSVALVPVDLAPPSVALARDVAYLFDRVETANPEYGRLTRQNHLLVDTGGFAYLNSVDSGTLWSAIEQEMRATVEALGDGRLNEVYSSWIRAHESREIAMMKRVEHYATESPFNKGVFLVGLAHGKSMRARLRDFRGESPGQVRWHFLEMGGSAVVTGEWEVA